MACGVLEGKARTRRPFGPRRPAHFDLQYFVAPGRPI
jgi:hypothetical protein